MKKMMIMLLVLMMLPSWALAEDISVAALKGPTAMGMVEMMEDAGDAFAFEIMASADEITPKLVQGEIDIAALPANLAAILYQRTEGEIVVLGINTLGVMYIAGRDQGIDCVEDLRGKTLYTAGKGSTPEYALNYILKMNGLEPGVDVQIEFRAEHAECLSALMNDADALAMLPQPFLTTAMMKAPEIGMLLDLTEEWEKLESGSGMITGVVVARKDFAEDNPASVGEFLEKYGRSVAFVNEDPAAAAVLVEKYGIVKAVVAEKALPHCNICLITGEEMQAMLGGYLQVLFEQEPKSVGGALPDGEFYYIEG